MGISRVCFFKGGGRTRSEISYSAEIFRKADDVGRNRRKMWTECAQFCSLVIRTASYVHMGIIELPLTPIL